VVKLSRTQTVALIVFLVIVWGMNWPLAKIALSYSPPVLFSGLRTLLGGICLLIVALPRYRKLRFKENWLPYVFTALFNIMLYYGLQTVGLQYLPSGLFASIVFLQPVLVGFMAWLWLGESMHGLKILGLLLGFIGVGVMSEGGFTGTLSLAGVLLAVGSALSWALGTVYTKKAGSGVDLVWLVTMQLIIGGGFLTIGGTAVESWSDIVWNPTFIACLLFISIFVIAVGWLVYFTLIDSGEAGKVAANMFMVPVVAIFGGVLLRREAVTPTLLAGLALIVASIIFVNLNPRKSSLV
jgi:drug/metabolite transporter (DMT)-like permease